MLNLLRNQTLLQSQTFPQFESMTDFSFLSLPAVVVKLFSIETEYLWFFSKRHAASLVNWQFYCGSCCILYKPHRKCVTFDNLICSESTLWKQFCKTSSTLVFKYSPFSKEKATKELTNLLALHIYKCPLNHHYFSMIIYSIWY